MLHICYASVALSVTRQIGVTAASKKLGRLYAAIAEKQAVALGRTRPIVAFRDSLQSGISAYQSMHSERCSDSNYCITEYRFSWLIAIVPLTFVEVRSFQKQ